MPGSAIDTLAPVEGLAVTLSEGLLSVTIDRPDSLNSVTTQVLAGIADAMEYAAMDPRVKVVRLGGSGRGFCSGAGMSADDLSSELQRSVAAVRSRSEQLGISLRLVTVRRPGGLSALGLPKART